MNRIITFRNRVWCVVSHYWKFVELNIFKAFYPHWKTEKDNDSKIMLITPKYDVNLLRPS